MTNIEINSVEAVILSCVLQREDFVREVLPFIKEDLFESFFPKVIFSHMSSYFERYKNLPTAEALVLSVEKDRRLNDDSINNIIDTIGVLYDTDTSKHKLEWLVDTTEKWVQERTLMKAILECVTILNDDDKKKDKSSILDIVKDATNIHFDRNVGHDYIDDADKRFEFYTKSENKIPFDISMLNTITNGGITKKTMNLICAESGGGKSMMLTHLAASYIKAGLNVLYTTMEMAEERIAERVDSNLMNIPIQDIQNLPFNQYAKNVEKIRNNYTGKLVIKEYPTGAANANHFRFLFDELETKREFVPDILIVDYLNICASSRTKAGNGANTYTLIKSVAEELRGLAIEKNVALLTAVQLNRGGMTNSDPSMTDVADSIGISYTADLMLGLINTEELLQMGQCMIKQLKNRYHDVASNNKFVIGVERPKMRFFDVKQSSISQFEEEEFKPESDDYGSGFGRQELKFKEHKEKYATFKFDE